MKVVACHLPRPACADQILSNVRGKTHVAHPLRECSSQAHARAPTLGVRESYEKRALVLPAYAQAGPHARLSLSHGMS